MWGVCANLREVSDLTECKEDFSSHRLLSDSGRVCFVKWRASFLGAKSCRYH